ncbi:MAG: S9 family peptidase [Planctomycetota bacterium]
MRSRLGALCLLGLWLVAVACQSPVSDQPLQTDSAPLEPTIEVAVAQDRLPLDVAWMHSDDVDQLTAVPQVAWSRNGLALILDPRLPDAERTFEWLDAKTGERRPATDAAEALRSLGQQYAGSLPEALTWPADLSSDCRRALYVMGEDLWLLELDDSRFVRLTETDKPEMSARFSPDGEQVAFVRDNDLYTVEIATGEERRLTRDGSETVLNGTLSWVYWEEIFGRRDLGYWWSPDSRAIAFLRTDESAVGEAYFLDPSTPYARLITQRYPKAGTANPSVRLGVVGSRGDHRHWIDLTTVEHEYVARVDWMPDSRRLAVQTITRDQHRLDLSFVDPSAGTLQPILQEDDPAWINLHDDLVFLDEGDAFLWSSERDGYTHLYRYRSDGTLLNAVTRGNWSVRSSAGAFWVSQSIAAVDEDEGWIYFTGQADSSIERHLYRCRLDGSERERLTAAAGTHRITAGPKGHYFVAESSDLVTPPALRLHDRTGSVRSVLASPRTDLVRKYALVEPELLTIPARDGFEMPASLIRPADYRPGRRYPLIVNVYGGPSAPMVANAWGGSDPFDQVLSRSGFFVLRVDNRSATAISKTLESTVLFQLNGDSELNDLVDAIRHIKEREDVDPERIGIWGWSGGGSLTLLGMTQSEEFRAGIAVAALTNWRFYDTKWAEFANKMPEVNPGGYERTNLNRFAADLHGRLLLVHGTYDDNVHPQNAWQFVDALVAANKPFDMMFYPMRKHGISDRPARLHLYQTMLDFWNRELGGDAPAIDAPR